MVCRGLRASLLRGAWPMSAPRPWPHAFRQLRSRPSSSSSRRRPGGRAEQHVAAPPAVPGAGKPPAPGG
eukprot:13179280-Alexandrium_andersonii.AAC.1